MERFAAAILGLAFTGQFIRVMALESLANGVSQQGSYSLEAVMTMLGSPMWTFAGAMHLLAALSLGVLALRSKQNRDAAAGLAAIAAVVGSACFLVLSMSHFHGLAEVESAQHWCAANEQAALVSYNLLRVITLGAGLFALGAFLILRSAGHLQSGTSRNAIVWIGFLAGIFCVLFALIPSPSDLITRLALAGVIVWSVGQLVGARQ